ncbi:MAG: 5-formyltetrahydrofolate cyclo-ligase [Desulfobacterales bacterium]|jgi:5-formyltetrahydrofolate cyclo-ligase
MDEIREAKQELREKIEKSIKAIPEEEYRTKTGEIETRLFDFANFLESRIVLLYVNGAMEVATDKIIKKASDYGKIIILPVFEAESGHTRLLKVDDPYRDLIKGPNGLLTPDPKRCREVPLECIDIAIIPGIAVDEKGGRIGAGDGHYNRLIPQLPITTRKVTLVLEDQVVPQIPAESHDKHIDIIITDKRIIYKI